MAFRMQASVPELMDLSGEPASTLELYGCKPGDGSFASNCLLARRLAERGVRFIQMYHKDWDHHGGVKQGVEFKAEEIDRACMALITDLKQRDMLHDTLIVWAGEFGRTPMSQGGDGRDHHNAGFTVWMCGGGIKPGTTYGETCEYGYNVVKDGVHVHDFHATMLHLLGIDHERLTYKFQGRNFRL
jgi:arylsulfatase A-like enzyme